MFKPSLGKLSIPSIELPITFSNRPRAASPFGITIGLPKAATFNPRRNPSVASIAIQRMVFSPRCCWHSIIKLSFPSRIISNASLIAGKSPPSLSKLTSTTGPITCIISPMFLAINYFDFKMWLIIMTYREQI